ncbi:Urotensin-2 [Camelus dromedarius]|uniref:Urotensin-2 n=1 Tax=Camelus dromedarius TaxID=9838 RepID=A0A5N4DDP1_CAMDR|nr:Urotensin-2 [Camelus dromedarius]
MYKLASCCLLFIGCLSPLFSLPVLDSMEESLQLSGEMIFSSYSPEDVRSALDELERASLLQALPEMSVPSIGTQFIDNLFFVCLDCFNFRLSLDKILPIYWVTFWPESGNNIRSVDLPLNVSGNTVSEVK